MISKNNSKRLYYLIRFIGPIFFFIYLNEIFHEINVVFHEINVAFLKICYQIEVFLLQIELIFFMIHVVSSCSLVLVSLIRIKVLINPTIDKFKIVLLRKLKDKIDTLDKRNVSRIFFIYYFITLTAPISILCCFFWNEVCSELSLNLFYFNFFLCNLEQYFFAPSFDAWPR